MFVLVFKDIGFKYEPYLCNGCHDLMQKSMSFNDVAIIYIKGYTYKIHFWYMAKDDAISIMNNSNLIDKKGVFNFFSLHVKMSDLTYHQKNRYLMLNRAKDYYDNDKERLKEQARNKCRNVSEEGKNKRREYGKNRYHNMSEEKKKLTEYQINYREAKKSQSNNQFCMQCFLIHNIYVN